ncbi:MAG: GNAT family N-acetyltransferase [Anaerolineae bacterium]|nr:GNAT family N-acetyltransferase [Anaerolineae bacterium]
MNLRTALSSVEDFYRRVYWYSDEATTVEGDGFTLSFSGLPWMHSVNHLWLHDIDALDDVLLKLAVQFFRRFNAEYSIVFTAVERPRLLFWLADRLYIERANTPMYALSGLPRPLNMHRDVRICRARSEDQEVILEILHKTFFMTPEAGRCVVRQEHFNDPTVRHYIAYVNDEAAACASILLHDRLASVWNVGTLRQFRRQGIASAILMRALVEAAQDGCDHSVLMASPMGKALYEEMGYHFVATTWFYGPME